MWRYFRSRRSLSQREIWRQDVHRTPWPGPVPCARRNAPLHALVGSMLAHRSNPVLPQPRPLRLSEFTVRPDPDDPRLSITVPRLDQVGRPIAPDLVTERPLK